MRIKCNFRSEKLGMEVSASVIMSRQHKNGFMYLLHDNSENYTYFDRILNLEQICGEKDIATIVPDLDLSCCLDINDGDAYYTFLKKELPEQMGKYFGMKNYDLQYVAGVGTGAYGAFRLAGESSLSFQSACGILPILDLEKYAIEQEKIGKRRRYRDGLIGDKTRDEWDLLCISEHKQNLSEKYIYQVVADNAYLAENMKFYDLMLQLGASVTMDKPTGENIGVVIDKALHHFITHSIRGE